MCCGTGEEVDLVVPVRARLLAYVDVRLWKKQKHTGTAMQHVADQQPIAQIARCAAAGGADRDRDQRSPQASVYQSLHSRR